MMDLIEDVTMTSPIQMVEDLFEGQRIEQLLNYVDERERQVLTLIRGPQAFRLALAPLTNDFVALLKDSTLVSVLTVVELTKQTQMCATNLGSWVIPGILCAALYLVMSLPLAALARQLERRWKVSPA
jgi:ABC-type amino acid transport system permease subunit